MWKNFKFYLAMLCMSVACLLPMALLKIPEEMVEYIGLPGAFVVFGAGGGLIYTIYALASENYDEKWKENHELIMKILTTVFSVIAIGLHILLRVLYGTNGFLMYDLMVLFDGKDITKLILELLTIIISGLSLFSMYVLLIGNIDTEVHLWVRTTYINGEPVKKELVSHSDNASRVSFFFTTVLAATMGIMASSFPVLVFALFFNIASFIKGKAKIVPYILGAILTAGIIGHNLYSVINLGGVSNDANINIALELMPLMYILLTVGFLALFFNFEWAGHPVFVVIASVVMLFVSYMASLGLSYLILMLPIF